MKPNFHINYSFLQNPILFAQTQLMQLGRLYCTPDLVIEKHAHANWYELTVITDGSGMILTNGIPTDVVTGDIYFSYPGDFHEIRSSKEAPLKYDFFAFNTINPIIKEELDRIASIYLYTQRKLRDKQINHCIAGAIAEMAAIQEFSHEILCLSFEQVLYYLIRYFRSEKVRKKQTHTASKDELCYQIMHYIDTNLYLLDNLSELSSVFDYNYSYLSDLFKKNTGITILNYYSTRRMDAAKLLRTQYEKQPVL